MRCWPVWVTAPSKFKTCENERSSDPVALTGAAARCAQAGCGVAGAIGLDEAGDDRNGGEPASFTVAGPEKRQRPRRSRAIGSQLRHRAKLRSRGKSRCFDAAVPASHRVFTISHETNLAGGLSISDNVGQNCEVVHSLPAGPVLVCCARPPLQLGPRQSSATN